MVKRREDESIEDLIARFKRQVVKDNILAEVRKREYYMKPGVKIREKRKANAAKKRKKYNNRVR